MDKDQREHGSRSSSSDDHDSEKDQISINQQENVLKEEEEDQESSLDASFKAVKESQESDMERCKQEEEMLKKKLQDLECSENISSLDDDDDDSDKKMSSKRISTGDQGSSSSSSTQEADVIKEEDRQARLNQEWVIIGCIDASDKSVKALQELVERCTQDGEVLKKLLEDDTKKYTQDEINSLQETYEECKLYEEGLKNVSSIFAQENKLMNDGAKLDESHVILMLHGQPWKQKLQVVCHSFHQMMYKIDRMLSLRKSSPAPPNQQQQNIQDDSSSSK